MSTYSYRCDRHGAVDVQLPIGTATPTRRCPSCDAHMPRVFTAPMLGLAPRAILAAIDRTRASAESPTVVTRPPDAGRRARQTPALPNPARSTAARSTAANPAWRRLPKP